MRKKDIIKLKVGEREELKKVVKKGKEKARKITRSRILLLADQGKKDGEIMEALGVARNTVRQVHKRYVKEGIEGAIQERSRSGAPAKFTGRQKAKITTIACSTAPEGHSRWSIRLLADKAVELKIVDEISHMSIERILKKTNLSPI